MVGEAFVESVSEVIAHLEAADVMRARAQLAALLELMGQIPKPTAEAVGKRRVAESACDLKWASQSNCKEALAILRWVRGRWTASHPAGAPIQALN
jgi:hypothetical protein